MSVENRFITGRPGLRRGIIDAAAILLILSCGCESAPRTGSPAATIPGVPTYAQIAQAQNERVAKLQQTYSQGVLQLKWEDEEGMHSEPQVDIELWLDLPLRTSVRVKKLGDVYFWIGSNEQSFWAFDLLDRNDKTAMIRDRGDESGREAMTFFGIEPESLLDLMALRSLPEPGEDDEKQVESAADRDAWVLSGLGEHGTTRMFFEKGTLRPIRIELRSPEGELLLHSTLSRYASVTQIGVSPLSFPAAPMWIDIVDEAGGGFAKLHLNEMTADVTDEPFNVVFDLDRLLEWARPHRVDAP